MACHNAGMSEQAAIRLHSLPAHNKWKMRDGNEVEIRSIQPEDEPLMIKFHQGLSERSVYMRYFESLSLASRTRHDRLAKICIPKPGDEAVLVAVRAGKQTRSNEIIGVARLSMLAASNSAEVAVLISDNSQGHGLGTELMRRLIDCARARKISRLSAEILRDNTVMQSIFRKLGFTLRQLEDPRTIKAVVEL